MVPWHPPCALISLIFSSLDPETNCCYIEDWLAWLRWLLPSLPDQYRLLRFATGLHIESLFVQLSRCKQLLRFISLELFSGVRFRTLKAIQTRNAFLNSFRCDAVRLCQPSSCEFDLLSSSAAMLYPPCGGFWTIGSDSFDSSPSSFPSYRPSDETFLFRVRFAP